MAIVKAKKPHVLVVPFPVQGHVRPLMKLSRQIAKHGIKVTFVSIQTIHEKLLAAAKLSKDEEKVDLEEDNIVMTSIPDGRRPEDDPNDSFILLESLRDSMPRSLTDLIEMINSSNPDEKISCVIMDVTIEWLSETAEKMGAEPVIFMPASGAGLTMLRHLGRLVDDGSLDSNGSIIRGEKISVWDDIPAWRVNELTWSIPFDLTTQKIFFDCALRIEKTINRIKWLLGNTFYQLEPAACDLNPNFLPIGPLLEMNRSKSSSSIHPEDTSCLSWLDEKPYGSVVYVSFGSLAVFSQQQLDELALGLELSGRPFLWVVRPDLANGSRAEFPDGFLERVNSLGIGKIVDWAPQERVLSHTSIACFVSHCGWNSTLEGLSNGVPFLCWPYFSDQYHNQNYICDQWKIGLRIVPDENGIRSRGEIKTKIEMLFSNDNMKANALKLKELAEESVNEGGSSYKNFEIFIEHLIK
uniref:UDP-glycosyltransferase n=1 Tax=Scoparia dulcis TaxID=107240 RepID=A0A5H2Q6F2_SCODU|nr:UDP-glycosyltransferase [Scoparia dulcis]